MADEADRSAPYIEAVEHDGLARARAAIANPRLKPIIQRIEGSTHRVGLCHYCQSNIAPGHLFCHVDKDEPEQSCSVQWEYEDARRRDQGR